MRAAGLARLPAALALVCAAALAGPAPGAAAAPAIRFEAEAVDLGPLVQGERPSCTFSFANDGPEPLRIIAVEPTCGCTTALLSGSEIPPGGRGVIQVFFDSSNFAGEVTKEIEVHSSDPGRPTVVLRLRALVEPEVLLEPVQLVFPEVSPGAEERDLVFLTNRRGEPIRIRSAEIFPGSFSFRVPVWVDRARPLTVEPGERIEIEIAVSAPAALAMPLAGELVLAIEGPRKGTFPIKLLALPSGSGLRP